MSHQACLAVVVDGADQIRRARLPVTDLGRHDSVFEPVLRHWRERHVAGRLPSRKDIDPLELRPALGWMHIVETETENPLGYWYRLWGSNIYLDGGANYARTTVGDCRQQAYREAVAADYFTVVATGIPAYHEIDAVIDQLSYRYARLMLPLSNDGRQISHLLIGIHMRNKLLTM